MHAPLSWNLGLLIKTVLQLNPDSDEAITDDSRISRLEELANTFPDFYNASEVLVNSIETKGNGNTHHNTSHVTVPMQTKVDGVRAALVAATNFWVAARNLLKNAHSRKTEEDDDLDDRNSPLSSEFITAIVEPSDALVRQKFSYFIDFFDNEEKR